MDALEHALVRHIVYADDPLQIKAQFVVAAFALATETTPNRRKTQPRQLALERKMSTPFSCSSLLSQDLKVAECMAPMHLMPTLVTLSSCLCSPSVARAAPHVSAH
jgi:hypothetical protein